MLTQIQISNLFVGAIEGGSNYWCAKIRPLNKDDKRSYDVYMLDGFIAWEEEESTHGQGLKRTVTKDDIDVAVKIMSEKYNRHFNDVLNENDDAETADVFLQLCCFKTLVYG